MTLALLVRKSAGSEEERDEALESVIGEANSGGVGREQQQQGEEEDEDDVGELPMAVPSCKHLCARGVLPPHLPSMNAASPPLSRQAVFGHVAPLLHFKTEEEVVRIANDINAAAHSFTNNVQCSWRATEALEYRLISVNKGLISTGAARFRGVKQSGLGQEGSKYRIDEYVELKYMRLGNMTGY